MADEAPVIYQFQKLSAAPLPGNPIFLNVAEAAKLLRVTRAVVYQAVDRGQIPAVQLGNGTIRIPYQGLLDLVETQAAAWSAKHQRDRGIVEQWASNTRRGPTKTGP